MPIVLGLVIDHGVLAGDLRLTVLGALGLIALRVLGVALWTYTFIESQKACMLERHRLRVGLTGAVLDPRSRAVRRPAGEVLSIATSDADRASDVMDMLPWVVPSAVTVLAAAAYLAARSEEHTSELQSRGHLVCRLLLEKKKQRGERNASGRLGST